MDHGDPGTPGGVSFRERLTALSKLTVELAPCTDADELCRRAVRQAREQLGFERIGVWLTIEDSSQVRGTYGIDEQGQLRDERESRIDVHPKSLMGRLLQGGVPFYMEETGPLYDGDGNEVGAGSHALAPLWDGTRVIGMTSIDNALTHAPLTQQDCELLGLFTSSLGAQLSRLWTEEAYRTVVDHSLQGLAVFQDFRVVFANAAVEQITGYPVEDLVDMGPGVVEKALVHPDDFGWLTRRHADRVAGRPVPFHYEARLVRKSGETIWVELFVATVTYHGQPAVQVAFIDITERRRTEREVIEIERREQRRIGRDLHDALGQELAGIAYMAKALQVEAGNPSPALVESAVKLEETARHALAQCRHIAHGLVPVQLDREGLAHELSQLASRTRDLYGVECECVIPDGSEVGNHTVALHLYYITQEAVNNALRHGKSRSIHISLRTDDRRGELAVTDDGQWRERDSGDDAGMGLRIMEYRARVIGGHLRVEHGQEQNTRVACTFEDRDEGN